LESRLALFLGMSRSSSMGGVEYALVRCEPSNHLRCSNSSFGLKDSWIKSNTATVAIKGICLYDTQIAKALCTRSEYSPADAFISRAREIIRLARFRPPFLLAFPCFVGECDVGVGVFVCGV